nr:MAG TPA_asm: hypothetical protein [Caudoviricetes sp.]
MITACIGLPTAYVNCYIFEASPQPFLTLRMK